MDLTFKVDFQHLNDSFPIALNLQFCENCISENSYDPVRKSIAE